MTTIHVTNTHYYHKFFVFSYTMLGMDHQRFPLIGIVIPFFVFFLIFYFYFYLAELWFSCPHYIDFLGQPPWKSSSPCGRRRWMDGVGDSSDGYH